MLSYFISFFFNQSNVNFLLFVNMCVCAYNYICSVNNKHILLTQAIFSVKLEMKWQTSLESYDLCTKYSRIPYLILLQ